MISNSLNGFDRSGEAIRRLVALSVFTLIVFTMGGCRGTIDVRHYSLLPSASSAASADLRPPISYVLAPIDMPDVYHRSEIVLRRSSHIPIVAIHDRVISAVGSVFGGSPEDIPAPDPKGVEILPNDLWEAPLPDAVWNSLASGITSRVGSPPITDVETASRLHALRISIRILNFGPGQDSKAVLVAAWSISNQDIPSSNEERRAEYVSFARAGDIPAKVAVMRELLGDLEHDVSTRLMQMSRNMETR